MTIIRSSLQTVQVNVTYRLPARKTLCKEMPDQKRNFEEKEDSAK